MHFTPQPHIRLHAAFHLLGVNMGVFLISLLYLALLAAKAVNRPYQGIPMLDDAAWKNRFVRKI